MAELITLSAYARRIGKSQPYVSKLVKQGKIPTTDGRIDPEVADAALAAFREPNRQRVVDINAARRRLKPETKTGSAEPETPAVEPRPPKLATAMADDKFYAAGLKRLAFEKEEKLLVSREVVELEMESAAIQFRDDLLRVGPSIGPALARTADATACSDLVTMHMHEVLSRLSASFGSTLKKLVQPAP